MDKLYNYEKIFLFLKEHKKTEFSLGYIKEKFNLPTEQSTLNQLRRLRYTDNIKLTQSRNPLITRKKAGIKIRTWHAKYDEEHSDKIIKEALR